jgi:hypothetical protein
MASDSSRSIFRSRSNGMKGGHSSSNTNKRCSCDHCANGGDVEMTLADPTEIRTPTVPVPVVEPPMAPGPVRMQMAPVPLLYLPILAPMLTTLLAPPPKIVAPYQPVLQCMEVDACNCKKYNIYLHHYQATGKMKPGPKPHDPICPNQPKHKKKHKSQ